MKEGIGQLDTLMQAIIAQLDRKEKKELIGKLEGEKDFPVDYAADIFLGNKAPGELGEFEKFCVLDVLGKEEIINKYYTKPEITRYGKEKFKQDTLDFPQKALVFDMVEVMKDQQYVGKYSVKELMKLRNHSLLDYNANTQRVMTYKIHNGEGMYKISINYKAVNEIKSNMLEGIYIPNTITLNMNPEKNPEFEYNNGKLFVKSIDGFDILDGFHRYLAMGQIYDLNPDWDYPLELRICSFSDSRAKQFIYQEDQKTPMNKTASKSMNQYSKINQVIQRVNEDSVFNLCNQLKANGLLDAGILAEGLESLKVNTQKEVFDESVLLKDYINKVIEKDWSLTEKKWSKRQIVLLAYGYVMKIDVDHIVRAINKVDDMLSNTFYIYRLNTENKRWCKEVLDNV